MKPEPLKNKDLEGDTISTFPDGTVRESAFYGKDIKSAVDWYQLYKYDEPKFQKEYPDYYNEWVNSEIYSETNFQDYLFIKAFEDVMKDE